MNILVLNKNIVVSKLISLAVKEFDVTIIEVESCTQINKDIYDIVFIDDSCYNNNSLNLINDIKSPTKILLYSYLINNFNDINFDYKVKKPFLPLAIIDILNKVFQKKSEDIADVNDLSILLDYDDIKLDEVADEENQVESIKNMLIDEPIDDILFENEDINTNEMNGNELFDLLLDTKVETLKHIFAGAEINISIKFPKDNR